MRPGKYFESLISWINETLHENAIIKSNDYLIDKETGNKRQIDITIRLNDGPTDFLAIVEVRDRTRPVGVEYVEQIKSKRDSVKANLAIIVSKNGFYESAIKKADNYGIKLYSANEAFQVNWSNTIKNLKPIIIQSITGNMTFYILDRETEKIIDLQKDFLSRLSNCSRNDLIFLDKNKKPSMSLNDLLSAATLPDNKELWGRLEIGEQNKKYQQLFCSMDMPEKIYFYDINNLFVPIDLYCFVGEFWINQVTQIPKVIHYKDNNHLLAEVVTFDISKDQFVEMLTKNPNNLNEKKELKVRINKNSP